MFTYKGVQMVGRVLCAAGSSASVIPAKSNSPFRNLTISIIPIENPSPYKAYAYHDGALVESHDFPDPAGRSVCHMAYPNAIFPANIGTDSITKYFEESKDYYGIPIRVTIENYAASAKPFLVYACFEAMDGASFGEVTQL